LVKMSWEDLTDEDLILSNVHVETTTTKLIEDFDFEDTQRKPSGLVVFPPQLGYGQYGAFTEEIQSSPQDSSSFITQPVRNWRKGLGDNFLFCGT